MTAALIVLILLLLLLGGGGFVYSILWYALVIGLVLWALGFLIRSAEGSGRWYRW